MKNLLILLAFTIGLCSTAAAQEDCITTEYLSLYQKFLLGDLDYAKQDAKTQTCLAAIHSLMARSQAPSSNSECEDAWSYANSAADDIETYAKRLIRCVSSGDFYDDCSSELRRVRSAHSDYEQYVYEVQSYCC